MRANLELRLASKKNGEASMLKIIPLTVEFVLCDKKHSGSHVLQGCVPRRSKIKRMTTGESVVRRDLLNDPSQLSSTPSEMFGLSSSHFPEDHSDPFLGVNNLFQQMDSVMRSVFEPYGMGMGFNPMMAPALMAPGFNYGIPRPQPPNNNQLMPFGAGGNPFGMNLQSMFSNMAASPNCQMYSSSSAMTVVTGPDGRPQVYQATSATRSGPGGVRETRRTVTDPRSGIKRMAIGRHVGDRAHVLEKEQNLHTGDCEEKEDLVNLEEEELPQFDEEWKRRHGFGMSQRTQDVTPAPRQLAIASGPAGHEESTRSHPYQSGHNERHNARRQRRSRPETNL